MIRSAHLLIAGMMGTAGLQDRPKPRQAIDLVLPHLASDRRSQKWVEKRGGEGYSTLQTEFSNVN